MCLCGDTLSQLYLSAVINLPLIKRATCVNVCYRSLFSSSSLTPLLCDKRIVRNDFLGCSVELREVSKRRDFKIIELFTGEIDVLLH